MTMHLTRSRRSTLAETTAIKDWDARRYGKTSIPSSSLSGPSRRWPITRFGSLGSTEVTNWDIPDNSGGMGSRRTWKRRLPESSLMGIGSLSLMGIGSLSAHVGTAAERRWGINPLSETTYVEDTAARRVGKQRWYGDDAWHEQASLSGFGAFGADLDSNASVRDVQETLRKLGLCIGNGRVMTIDGVFGPVTSDALSSALSMFNQRVAPLPQERAYAGSTGAREIQISSTFWTALQTMASGRIDQCSAGGGGGRGGGGGGGGGSEGGGSDEELPPDLETGSEDAWYMRPTTWLVAALVAGAGIWAYNQSQQEYPLLPESDFDRMTVPGGSW